jgi:hypothetical protein
MPNPNPHRARLARKSARKPGDLRGLQRKLWGAILHCEDVLEAADTPELRLRAIHAMSQATGAYVRVLEVGELEARLTALEKRMEVA